MLPEVTKITKGVMPCSATALYYGNSAPKGNILFHADEVDRKRAIGSQLLDFVNPALANGR